MSAAFLISAAHPPGSSASDVLQALLRKAGLPARRVAARQMAELHWLLAPGEDGAWLPQTLHALGFAPDLAVFAWPSAALLDHYLLHSAARSIQAGQRELIIIGQSGAPQAAGVLLASPTAVGRYNLAPRARLAALLALSAAPDGLAIAASAAIQRLAERERSARQPAQTKASGAQQPFMHVLPEMLPNGDLRAGQPGQPQEIDEEPQRYDLPLCAEIAWLAGEMQPTAHSAAFPRAQWLASTANVGALAQLAALMVALEKREPETQPETWGALLSSGPLENGLCTLLERT